METKHAKKTNALQVIDITEPVRKVGLNLEETLKVVEDLHQKKRHLERLKFSINTLEEFELKQEVEDLDQKSYYTGCEIELTDDNRKKWTTKNPNIIREMVNFLKTKFNDKVAEIEAQIVLPL